jgi:hypothetical protein
MRIGGMATVPKRIGSLQAVLDSIVGQVDEMYVALNGNFDMDKLPCYDNVWYKVLDNSLGDSAKMLHANTPNCIYYSFDDDLVYNSHHCDYLESKVKQYNAIVTLHGRQFKNRPIKSFRRSATLNYHCLYPQSKDVRLDIGGTGVMAFDTNRFHVSIEDFTLPNMADIFLAKKSNAEGVQIYGIAHQSNYLRYIQQEETIWLSSKDDTIQTRILNSFLK